MVFSGGADQAGEPPADGILCFKIPLCRDFTRSVLGADSDILCWDFISPVFTWEKSRCVRGWFGNRQKGGRMATVPLLGPLLPPGVRACERVDDAPAEPLFESERTYIARAAPRRQAEFRAVRACARTALAGLGFERAPLLPGRTGAPVWPDGVRGSMTHCTGYRAAAVVRAGDLGGLGIDAELNRDDLDEEVLRLVAFGRELDQVAALERAEPAVAWRRLLFSAKESVYKAWSPRTGGWLGFEEVTLTLELAGSFTVALGPRARGLDPAVYQGWWRVVDGLVLTVAAVDERLSE